MPNQAISGQWLPYPNHPLVRECTRLLEDLRERPLDAFAAGKSPEAQILDELQRVRERRNEITSALLRDRYLDPQWVAHSEADAACGAMPCLECGNNVLAGESQCSYCGWTYLAELPNT
jgi:hypothetical protein